MGADPRSAGSVVLVALYAVEALPEVVEQLEAWPREAHLAYAELVGFLQLTPEHGTPYNAELADGKMRTQPFGAGEQGLATYFVLDDERRVVVLAAVWLA